MVETAASHAAESELERVRADFPALEQEANGQPLVYLDSAATSLTPQPVIDAITSVYARDAGNIHRAVHLLSRRATEAFDAARAKVQAFIGAAAPEEVIFTRGTTESINLVAQSWGRKNLAAGDEILITGLEHHSNIVPWQMLAEVTGAVLVVAPIEDDGSVPLANIAAKLSERTRLVAMAHVSNALGTVLPVAEVCGLAREKGALTLVDGAQAVPHMAVDVAALGCDFYAFSGHKLYGPTGIGVLWGRRALLEAMPPYQGGGDMIRSVTFEKTLYAGLPSKFEAGTPHIAGAIGLGAAIDYVSEIGFAALEAHENDLLEYSTQALDALGGIRIIGRAPDKRGVVSFVMDAAHPHDIGTIVDSKGVAVRTGHHCAQPVMEHYGVAATARASFGMYNTRADVDALIEALAFVKEIFG